MDHTKGRISVCGAASAGRLCSPILKCPPHRDAENTQKEVPHERTGGLAAPPGWRCGRGTEAAGRRRGGAGPGRCGRRRRGDRRSGPAPRRHDRRVGAADAGRAAVAAGPGPLAAAGGGCDGWRACGCGRVAGDIHWLWRRPACRDSGDCVRRRPLARLAASAQLGRTDRRDHHRGCVWPAGSVGRPVGTGAAGDYWHRVDRVTCIDGRRR